jgi:hypothetical protein
LAVRPEGRFLATIVSEYGYSTFAESPNVLHEFRQVISVDGKSPEPQPGRLSLGRCQLGDEEVLRELGSTATPRRWCTLARIPPVRGGLADNSS